MFTPGGSPDLLHGDAHAVRKVARYMREVAAERPDRSVIASDLDRYGQMLFDTAEYLDDRADDAHE